VDDDLDSIRVLSEPETYRTLSLSDRTWERLKAAGDVPPKTRRRDSSSSGRWLDRLRRGAPGHDRDGG
jgi:hypothetical protein